MYNQENNSPSLKILQLSDMYGDTQNFILLNKFEIYCFEVVVMIPCDENYNLYEDYEYEFLYKMVNVNKPFVFAEDHLYEIFLKEYMKRLH